MSNFVPPSYLCELKTVLIYDSPSAGYFYNYNEVKHILESVYIKVLVKYPYQPPNPFLADLRKKKTFLDYAMVEHLYIRKDTKRNFFKEIKVDSHSG